MRYISLFSGIEAASVAWSNLGWTCLGVSEIDPFACAVLKHHFPNVPNLGNVSDITKEQINELKEQHPTEPLIVVGGSPCQSFSIAGNKKGLSDPRGQLMFQYIRVVKIARPKYFVWENVGGALSSNKGQDFACLLEEMAQLGYSLCWRVLDSQYFGVPQRRKRVFLIGCLGNPRGGYEVLFESESSQGNNEPSRKTRKEDPTKTETSIGKHDRRQKITMLKNTQSSTSCYEQTETSFTLTAAMGTGGGHVPMITGQSLHESRKQRCGYEEQKICPTLESAMGKGGGNIPMLVTEQSFGQYKFNNISATLRAARGSLDSNLVIQHDLDFETVGTLCARDYKGVATHDLPKGQKLICERRAFTQNSRCEVRYIGGDGNSVGGLSANSGAHQTNYIQEEVVYVAPNNEDVAAPISKANGEVWENQKTFMSLSTGGGQLGHGHASVRIENKVRRLTPKECERLQGFPDDWTKIPYRGKEAKDCPMSPRYKALGNSMAVPVMQWIGERIDLFEKYGNCDDHNFEPTNKPKKKSIESHTA